MRFCSCCGIDIPPMPEDILPQPGEIAGGICTCCGNVFTVQADGVVRDATEDEFENFIQFHPFRHFYLATLHAIDHREEIPA